MDRFLFHIPRLAALGADLGGFGILG